MPLRLLPLFIVLPVMLLVHAVAAPTPQGTAFTYQGVLKQNGNAINGNTDMVFDLFDAAVGGSAVGPSLAFASSNGNPVNVVNGVFNVTLDFGSTAFMTLITDQRFLRVTVNGTALAPRTQIQNEPYALQSQTAELAYSVSNASIGTAQIIASQVQRRVGGACAGGSAVNAVNQDGSVGCQAVGQGTITGVTPGNGLTGGGASGSVGLGIADPLTLSGTDTGSVVSVSNSGAGAGATAITTQSSHGVALSATGGVSGVVAAGTNYGVNASTDNASGYAILATNSGGGGSAVAIKAVATGGGVMGSSGIGVQGTASGATSKGVYGVSNDGWGVYGNSTTGVGVIGFGKGAGITGNSSDAAGYGVSGSNPTNYGVYGTGLTGVRGETASAATGAYGVAGISNVTDGTGVYGGGTKGVYGEGTIPSGSLFSITTGVYGKGSYGVHGWGTLEGVRGEATTAQAFGVLGTNQSGGTGVYGDGKTGVAGSSSNASGYGVSGTDSANIGVFGSGATGVRGETASATGFAVMGVNNGGGSGVSWGIYGQNTSSGGYAIEGYNPNGVGVRANGNPAGQFIGNVTIQGTLSKTAGSFQIDHPLDPANKYLFHSFVESPDMKNVYDGVATLDARGQATVELPTYFEALNKDFRYQLTAIGAPGPGVYVADEIAHNRFRIAGGASNQRVSWQVTGTRHDAYADAHRIEVEVAKPAGERGSYLFPVLFGASEQQSIHPITQRLSPTLTVAQP